MKHRAVSGSGGSTVDLGRRKFAYALGIAAVAPSIAIGQARIKVVSVFGPSTRQNEERTLKPFFDRMRELGWIEGRNVTFDRVYAEDKAERLPDLSRKIVDSKPDLIYAPAIDSSLAVAKATKVIPIVFGSALDPEGVGLVKSLNRPGGNITGTTMAFGALAAKRLEILREILPGLSKVGVLFNPTGSPSDKREFEKAGAAMGISIISTGAATVEELEKAIGTLMAQKVDALATSQSSLLFNSRKRVIDRATALKIPVLGHRQELVEDGALLSYSGSLAEQLRRSAELVDKILKGADPGELPVEQSSTFQLVINKKVARELAIPMPRSVISRADRVIE
jgi:putative tryptophan/tyrosine transport system substrate-binding protein